jgi:hypothetical protein
MHCPVQRTGRFGYQKQSRFGGHGAMDDAVPQVKQRMLCGPDASEYGLTIKNGHLERTSRPWLSQTFTFARPLPMKCAAAACEGSAERKQVSRTFTQCGN